MVSSPGPQFQGFVLSYLWQDETGKDDSIPIRSTAGLGLTRELARKTCLPEGHRPRSNRPITEPKAMDAFSAAVRTEGIFPAIESSAMSSRAR